MRASALLLLLVAALGTAASGPAGQVVAARGAALHDRGAALHGPRITAPPCSAPELRATYTKVPFSGVTGQLEYLLIVTNRSGSPSCTLAAPLALTLLVSDGQSLATKITSTRPGNYSVVLKTGQWAQAVSQLSPELSGPGEPTTRACEPVASALRITISGAGVRAPMDPTPVCEAGAIQFERLSAVAQSPVCSPGALQASFIRAFPPSNGLASYTLTLRNRFAFRCHTDSIVGLRLLGTGGRKLATRVRAGVSSPYVFGGHAVHTAVALLSTKDAGPPGSCDPLASGLAITPSPGGWTLTTRIRPPLKACRGGTIDLSGLFRKG